MENTNIFEVAAKEKFRFSFKGQLSVEDLYDLSLENLDMIFKSLNSQLKQSQEESLLGTKSKADKELDIKISIIKHIADEKLATKEKAIQARAIKEQKQKIQELIATKKNESLQNLPVEELQKMLNDME